MIEESKKHLEDSGWSYSEHLSHSVRQSNRLLIIAFKSYVHGLIPSIWIADGPLSIIKMYNNIKKMHHHRRLFKDDS